MREETPDGYQVDERRTCPTCGKVCANEAGMKRHHSWMHNESIARVVRVCDYCGGEKELYESQAAERATGYCKACLENADLGDDHPSAREHPPEVREKITEANRGMEISEATVRAAKEGWRKWWEQKDDKEEWVERMQAGLPDEKPEEERRRIAEALRGHEVTEETRQKIRESLTPAGVLNIEVGETGHTVKSYWEEEIDVYLHNLGIEYGYEPETFQLDGRAYTPDFIAGDTVIEVKGYARETDVRRAEQFLNERPEWTYVVVGAELPCDIHIPWEERERLADAL